MTFEQGIVFAVLGAAMALFAWGRWRFDVVAVLALLALVAAGIVPAAEAFHGFGHPAVITVAAVLIISRSLQDSGVVDNLVRFLAPTRHRTTTQVGAAGALTAAISAFMNNVGALALMLPVALRSAQRAGRSPAKVLMPLSFASLLGGLVTLIGTPPNIIVATFRGDAAGEPFGMFDFTPVGLAVAVAGIAYITLIGWRFLPENRRGEGSREGRFRIQAYTTEARVGPSSRLIGKSVRHLERLCENEATVMSIVRGERRRLAPRGIERLRAGDILVLEGDPAALEPLFDDGMLRQLAEHDVTPNEVRSDDVRVVEAVLMPDSPIEGQGMRALRMHDRYGVNLLAVARSDRRAVARLANVRFETGDVLLLQGERETLNQVMDDLGCLPLAERGLRPQNPRRRVVTLSIFVAAVTASAFGWVPIQIAFVAAVAALILAGRIAVRDAYESIEWPVVVLLAALIPVGEALEATGGTALIAGWIVGAAGDLPIWAMLALLVVASMWLSDLIHNSPTAILMAPIAVSVAGALNLSMDPFLMAVAVGSASPYLTPIGHQSNALVMGPGGYRFTDYARMGAPLELLIVAVSVPTIMAVWMP